MQPTFEIMLSGIIPAIHQRRLSKQLTTSGNPIHFDAVFFCGGHLTRNSDALD
jgi:hypothetical protein